METSLGAIPHRNVSVASRFGLGSRRVIGGGGLRCATEAPGRYSGGPRKPDDGPVGPQRFPGAGEGISVAFPAWRWTRRSGGGLTLLGEWYRRWIPCHLSDTLNVLCRIPLQKSEFGSPSRRGSRIIPDARLPRAHQGVGLVRSVGKPHENHTCT